MPPVDRLKPIRAASSESGYTLIEFMREFPEMPRAWNGCGEHAIPRTGRRPTVRSASVLVPQPEHDVP